MTTATTQAKLWYAMRASSMVLAVCVLVHIVTVIYAVRGGLSAAEILGRTHGNWIFGTFYPIRAELFSVERLEEHARSLAAAQPVTPKAAKGNPLGGRLVDSEAVLLHARGAPRSPRRPNG